MQSDQGLPCLVTESLDTIECFTGDQMPVRDFGHVQDDLKECILHMFEGTFLFDMVILFYT